MSSIDSEIPEFHAPPPRPTTPPVRRGFLRVLAVLSIITALAYGVPFMIDRAGYAWEAGRSRAAAETLARLDKDDVISRSSALFRLATEVITPAVVNIRSVSSSQPNNIELGSGVIIDKANGYIVTNEHVVHNADQIIVRVGRTGSIEGTVVGVDELTDLAVVKVRGPLVVQAEWGDSSKMEVGDWVLAIGSPFTLDRTVTAGIISATGRHGIGLAMAYEDYLQTDAAINPGNSGGPLINLEGKVVGINTAIINPEKGQGIGLAISSEIARKVVKQIIENGKVVRAYIGVVPEPLSPPLAKDSGLPDDTEGVYIGAVRAESPAHKAGLRAGDILVDVDGKTVADPKSLRTRTFILPIGSTIPVTFYRDGKKQTVEVTVAAMPELTAANRRAIGIQLTEIPADDGGGLLISEVDANSPAQESGLRRGMRIVAVGRSPVKNRADFEAAMIRFDPIHGIPIGILGPGGMVQIYTVTTFGTPRP
jgi:serine protease Do